MKRFDKMMAAQTTEIRPACMRASNEGSSMPPPFRAASPHPPLPFTFFAIFSLPSTGPSAKLLPTGPPSIASRRVCSFSSFVTLSSLLRLLRALESEMLRILRLTSPRYRACVFEDLDIRSMQLCHCNVKANRKSKGTFDGLSFLSFRTYECKSNRESTAFSS